MNAFVQEMKSYLEAFDIKYYDVDDLSIAVGGQCGEIPMLWVMMTFDEIGNAVHLHAQISQIRRGHSQCISTCNDLNEKYRWTKFYVREDGVWCTVDTYFGNDNCALICFGVFQIMLSIIKESYPQIMKSIWG